MKASTSARPSLITMVKSGEKLSRVQDKQEPCHTTEEFVEVPLEQKYAHHRQNQNNCKEPAKFATYPSEMDLDNDYQVKDEICAGTRTLNLEPVPENSAVELEHKKNLETLELAIAKKRSQMRKQIDEDHMKEKAALLKKLQQLEHTRLTQLQNFRAEVHQRTANIELLKQRYESCLAEHCKQEEEFRELEKSKTSAIVEQIDAVRAERTRIAPLIGEIDGKLQLMYDDDGTSPDNSIPKGMLEDLEVKFRDTQRENAKEDQEMEHFAGDQVDLLMDEINNLEQELDYEKRKVEETREIHQQKIGEIEVEIQKNKRTSPFSFEEEKHKIQEEVKALKEYWKHLRGHMEEQVEDILDHTEKKKFDGRDKLMKQRAAFFQERQKNSILLRDATSKLYEKQREVETARQLFYDRLHVKNAELDEMEDIHQERLKACCDRRDKRLKELELIELEKSKRLGLELTLMDAKRNKMIEGFELKKNHIQNSILDTEKRVEELSKELSHPRKKDQDKIHDLICKLAIIKHDRDNLAEQSDFVRLLAKEEINLTYQEGQTIANNYATFVGVKEKDLFSLQQKNDKLHAFDRRQDDINHEKFIKSTSELSKQTEKLQSYFDNLTEELVRLKDQRVLLRDEYIFAQEGIRNAILADEDDIENERQRIHEELDTEQDSFNRTLQAVNARIAEARRKRHEMTTRFKRDINIFTAKAMGISQGTVPPGSGPSCPKMLDNYQQQINKYTIRVHALNDKLELIRKEAEAKNNELSQKKLEEANKLKNQQSDLEVILRNKTKLVKEGNKLLQLFAGEDNCLYCRENYPSNNQRNQLNQLYEENRKITEKLTNLFKKEKEYDRISSRQLEELKTTLDLSSKFVATNNASDSPSKQHTRTRMNSQASICSSSGSSVAIAINTV
jgi:hypothetical protein